MLAVLAYDEMDGEPSQNMQIIWTKICAYYTAMNTPTQYSTLGLTSFSSNSNPRSSFPRLKGKGAEAKDLLPAIREIWTEFGCNYSDYEMVRDALAMMVEVQDILSDHSDELLLPLPMADRIAHCVDQFLLRYQHLAYKAETSGKFLWNMPSKFHWLWHWARKARFLNPRLTNCYIDEDFVGRIKTLVHSCAAGSSLQLMISKMSEKYRYAMHLMSADCGAL